MPKPLTLAAKLDDFPPVVVRLLARTGDRYRLRILSDVEIAARSGLAVREVHHLSTFTSWETVDVGVMQAFLRGCGANLDDRRWLQRTRQYMKTLKSIPKYLLRSPAWSTTFEPLIRIWMEHENERAA